MAAVWVVGCVIRLRHNENGVGWSDDAAGSPSGMLVTTVPVVILFLSGRRCNNDDGLAAVQASPDRGFIWGRYSLLFILL
jgi:hypothetical protein